MVSRFTRSSKLFSGSKSVLPFILLFALVLLNPLGANGLPRMAHVIDTGDPVLDQDFARIVGGIPGFDHQIILKESDQDQALAASEAVVVLAFQGLPRGESVAVRFTIRGEAVGEQIEYVLLARSDLKEALGVSAELRSRLSAQLREKLRGLDFWIPELKVYEIRKTRVIVDAGPSTHLYPGEEFSNSDGTVRARVIEVRGQYAYVDALAGLITPDTGPLVLERRIGLVLSSRLSTVILVEGSAIWDGFLAGLELAPQTGFESLRPMVGVDFGFAGMGTDPVTLYAGGDLPWRWGPATLSSSLSLGLVLEGSSMQLSHGRFLARIGYSYEFVEALSLGLEAGFMIAPAISEKFTRKHGALVGLGLHLKF